MTLALSLALNPSRCLHACAPTYCDVTYYGRYLRVLSSDLGTEQILIDEPPSAATVATATATAATAAAASVSANSDGFAASGVGVAAAAEAAAAATAAQRGNALDGLALITADEVP